MRTDNISVSFTITVPVDTPDKNGIVYKRRAIEDALQNTPEGLPILFASNNNHYTPHIIGFTTSSPYMVQFDDDLQLCKYCIDGRIFFGGTECIVETSNHGIVESVEIIGIGLSE